MITSILQIIAALLPALMEWIAKSKEDKYEDKQELRTALATGDTSTISLQLDKLREKARRRGLTGKQ